MPELPPALRLPPREAWKLRLTGFCFLLLPLSLVFFAARDFTGKIFADKIVATGNIFVMAKSDERAESAFARALSQAPVEAGMTFRKSSDQSRTYDVWLTGATRDKARGDLDALLLRFQKEFGGEFGRDVTTFVSSWAPPLQTPKVRDWNRRMRIIAGSLLAAGLAMLAARVTLTWIEVQAEKQRLARRLLEKDEGDDESELPEPRSTAGGEPEAKVL